MVCFCFSDSALTIDVPAKAYLVLCVWESGTTGIEFMDFMIAVVLEISVNYEIWHVLLLFQTLLILGREDDLMLTPRDSESNLAAKRGARARRSNWIGECQKVWGNQAAHASVAGVLPGPRFWGGGDIVDACELLVDHRVDNPLYDPGRGTRLPQRCRLAVCGSCGHISARIRHCPTLFGTPLTLLSKLSEVLPMKFSVGILELTYCANCAKCARFEGVDVRKT